MKRRCWASKILLAGGWVRKVHSCELILPFMKMNRDSEYGTKSLEGGAKNHRELDLEA